MNSLICGAVDGWREPVEFPGGRYGGGDHLYDYGANAGQVLGLMYLGLMCVF